MFQATNLLKSLGDGTTNISKGAVGFGISSGIGPVELVQEMEGSDLWKQAVSWNGEELLRGSFDLV